MIHSIAETTIGNRPTWYGSFVMSPGLEVIRGVAVWVFLLRTNLSPITTYVLSGFPLKVDRIYPDQHDTVRLRTTLRVHGSVSAIIEGCYRSLRTKNSGVSQGRRARSQV